MSKLTFAKATKAKSRLRLALFGPTGSGKTYTALRIAEPIALARGGRIAVIDSEAGSASKYGDIFDFDTLTLDSFSPLTYVDAIHAAEDAGYAVIIIDSLSHAWMGKDGALEQVDRFAARSQSGNKFTAWRDVTPMHNEMIEAMLRCSADLIATMRVKMEYVMEEVNGKKVPRKIGLQPVQRDGMEYEFDIVADLDVDHVLTVSKSRCSALDGKVFRNPGPDFAKPAYEWISSGVEAAPRQLPAPQDEPKPQAPKPATVPEGWPSPLGNSIGPELYHRMTAEMGVREGVSWQRFGQIARDAIEKKRAAGQQATDLPEHPEDWPASYAPNLIAAILKAPFKQQVDTAAVVTSVLAQAVAASMASKPQAEPHYIDDPAPEPVHQPSPEPAPQAPAKPEKPSSALCPGIWEWPNHEPGGSRCVCKWRDALLTAARLAVNGARAEKPNSRLAHADPRDLLEHYAAVHKLPVPAGGMKESDAAVAWRSFATPKDPINWADFIIPF